MLVFVRLNGIGSQGILQYDSKLRKGKFIAPLLSTSFERFILDWVFVIQETQSLICQGSIWSDDLPLEEKNESPEDTAPKD